MATERVIDLTNSRYCDRPYEGALPESTAAAEERVRRSKELALARMRARVAQDDDQSELALDILILLGLNE